MASTNLRNNCRNPHNNDLRVIWASFLIKLQLKKTKQIWKNKNRITTISHGVLILEILTETVISSFKTNKKSRKNCSTTPSLGNPVNQQRKKEEKIRKKRKKEERVLHNSRRLWQPVFPFSWLTQRRSVLHQFRKWRHCSRLNWSPSIGNSALSQPSLNTLFDLDVTRLLLFIDCDVTRCYL